MEWRIRQAWADSPSLQGFEEHCLCPNFLFSIDSSPSENLSGCQTNERTTNTRAQARKALFFESDTASAPRATIWCTVVEGLFEICIRQSDSTQLRFVVEMKETRESRRIS